MLHPTTRSEKPSCCGVKVLDFGLGKALEPIGNAENLSHSPTMTPVAFTAASVLLGTIAYMSPEQVRGKVADERADIWAFGCVLYEMLTGRQAFAGETASDVMGDILRAEPDWTALSTKVPLGLQLILKRCLQKDRRQRYHASGDLRHDLEALGSASIAAVAPARLTRKYIAWGLAGVSAIVAVAALSGAMYFRPEVSPSPASRFAIDLPNDAQLGPAPIEPFPSISPNGRFIVFRMLGRSQPGFQLFLRPIGSLTAQPMPGTEGLNVAFPFWSADSRFL